VSPWALSRKSLRNRRFTVALTVASIAVSVTLLLGVERLRREARESFTSTVSGTDLIVGARTGPVQLLLASVFRLGDAANTISWQTYETIASHPSVAWSVPISTGDSHRGYRVLGTTSAYLEHLRYGRGQAFELRHGTWFDDDSGAVLGAEVASRLGYGLGAEVVVTHGAGDVSFVEHDEHPFVVTGILQATGTPADRTIHVSLAGMDAIHRDMAVGHGHASGDPLAGLLDDGHDHDHHAHDHHDHPHPPGDAEEAVVGSEGHHHGGAGEITAFFLGLTNRPAVLGVQRMINQFEGEPLSAVVPALTLQQLWEIVGVVEQTLLVVSVLVVVVGLIVMLVAILTGLNERRREMAILRSVGARPAHIVGLIVGEAALITAAGVSLGLVMLNVALLAARPVLAARMGLFVDVGWPTGHELLLMFVILLAGILMGLLPAYRSYRHSLADGLTVKV
jgi:putative ABC transport system permease protein